MQLFEDSVGSPISDHTFPNRLNIRRLQLYTLISIQQAQIQTLGKILAGPERSLSSYRPRTCVLRRGDVLGTHGGCAIVRGDIRPLAFCPCHPRRRMHAFTATCGLPTTTNALSARVCSIELQSSPSYGCCNPGPPKAPVSINTDTCWHASSSAVPRQ